MLLGQNEGTYPGLALAYYSHDTSWIAAYGNRVWGTNDSIRTSTLFQLGSLGKVLTAIAVLQEVEEGQLSLENDIRKLLPWLESESPVSLRHLLTHSAGMNDKNIGYFSKDSNSLELLGDHLQNGLPSFYQTSGQEINYSNYSYALAGYLVELTSGMSFQDYVKENILDPLEMKDSFVGFDFDYHTKVEFALGHSATSNGFEPKNEYARHALPAGSFISSADDMYKLIRTFVRRDSSILSSRSWDLIFTRQFTNHQELGGYSLGLEEQVVGEKIFWAKGGMLGGYLSQLVILPDSSAFFLAINSSDDTFLEGFHSAFQEEFFIKKSVPPTSEDMPELSSFAGEYRNARYNREGVENIISLFRGAFEIWEGSTGLLAYHNGKMHTYLYLGKDVFVNSAHPHQKLIFKRDVDGKVIRLYRDVNIGGLSVPSTYEKTDWYNSPTFINEYYGIIPLIVLLYSIPLLFVILIWIVRIGKPKFWTWQLLPGQYYVIAGLAILALVLHIVKAVMPLVKTPMSFLFGLPNEFVFYNKIVFIIVLLSLIMIAQTISSFLNAKGSLLSRALYGIVALAYSLHAIFLYYWNFI